jgi:diaminohydroxyphosphoribosylaminopyrimidine deaminase/5-amino-6-(5-phosphoribosylamino)uracil reductase
MRLAMDLAERGRFTARPNPMVGAVVVKSGRIVGSGYHEKPGTGHGEVQALADVPSDVARGSTVYVNLEPCNFTGRTPPCSDLLVDKKVARVVCAMKDPNARVSGAGIEKLRASGIEVVVGVLAESAERLNAAYLTHRRLGRPYVTLKIAQSLDGSAATHSGDSKWITGPGARRRGHALRAESQAVAVGIGTVLADDPELTIRHVPGEQPIKVVFDSLLRTPLDARVLAGATCLVFTTEEVDHRRVDALCERGAEVLQIKSTEDAPDVITALDVLAERDIIHVLVEGGSRLAGSFLKQRAVDRVTVFTAPKMIGGYPSVPDIGIETMGETLTFENVVEETVGSDRLLIADVKYP